MKRSLLAALLLSAALAAPAQAIVGGRDATPGEYPWLVASGGCTGALVAPDLVLLAAHCVAGAEDPRTLPLRLGPVRRQAGRPLRVAQAASDPTFFKIKRGQPDGWQGHDVAVLQLATPVTDVAPLRVAAGDDDALLQPGRPLRAVGWGATEVGGTARAPRFGDASYDLHETDLAAVDHAACDRWYRTQAFEKGRVEASMVCAAGDRSSPCVGDSGGPLLSHDAKGAWVTLGVFSFMQRCGADGDPAVYTGPAAVRALLARPVWAPLAQTRPVVRGRARVGGTVRCTGARFANRVDRITYRWASRAGVSARSTSSRHVVTRAERGRTLTCQATATNPGGSGATRVAAGLRIAR